ncbi:conserved hypothetical protein [Synechococcus sp. PCC 7335]|uniref:UPF0182 family membrane protein n=1 Tax=Synechococcus sp. (strain ATCC 29403 / PCC 7335) TaxID=91464 RepID=UPI00017ECACD|nr:UPF0182 family protein [Synechococcus sp. PCC 7335]EDX86539.1 conserved hypothetical protein [Synechococcus sp. PCC 7335]
MNSPRPNLSKAPSRSYAWLWWLIGFLLLTIASAATLIHLLTEYWWFSAIGYDDVFQLRLGWSLLCAAIAFAAYVIVLGTNFWLALWLTRDRPFYAPKNSDWTPLIPNLITYGGITFIIILSLGAAQRGAQAWETLLKFLRPTAFNVVDPIYQQDVGFYIFRIPVYQGLQQQGLELLVWTLIIVLAVYALRGEIRLERGWKYLLTGPVKTHLCAILSAIALALALGYWLARYDLLYSANGVVFGAGYTDVNARLSAYTVMGFVTLVMAGLFIVSLWRSGFSLPLTSVGIYLTVLIVVGGIYPTLQQTLTVEPNELDKEKPFIAHNLDFTRQAYGLTNVQREDFAVEDDLAAPALEQNTATLDNIRLWGYQTLLSTYQELQSLRLYYRFHDVDIDRYTLNGDYRQVMLSARELDYEAVPEKAQNWVNKRLKYTHGYGVAMSPVNQVTIEGLPDFFVKNIPPETSVDLTINQPRIYYGEETDHHIFTGTSTEEFDYPLGNDNATNLYDGAGGVGMGSMFRRLIYAFEIGSLKPLISNYFTADSKIHYHRNIRERAQQIVPFLQLDSDPYLALVDGRFQWILDGYTTSDRYPYSEPLALSSNASEFLANTDQLQDVARNGTNYIRDAAKVVIDAYDGTLTVYAIDETDPILATYQKIFPSLFTPLGEASEDLRTHFRYPLNLFQIQSQMYRAYHMEDTEVFYNQEDLWQLPQQIGNNNNSEQMQPYYVIMRLPNIEGEEFLQILPFTPSRKDNMVAWMAARCDGNNYGQLVLYKFPKQVLVYGPQQIEARIDQNPDISEQLTLWNQQGSSVIRGNLLVIPVDQSLLYFEPVYLQADAGALPELKRVIVAFKNTIIMRQTLPEALEAIFGTQSAAVDSADDPGLATSTTPAPATLETIPASQREQVQAAIEAYEQGQVALQNGDWATYGETQKRLGALLQELDSEASREP